VTANPLDNGVGNTLVSIDAPTVLPEIPGSLELTSTAD
jgi:hypothetical protein